MRSSSHFFARFQLPPSIRELNLRMRVRCLCGCFSVECVVGHPVFATCLPHPQLCRYGLLRNHALRTLLPHAKFATFTPTRLGPTDANSSALDVTDLDSRSIASEVKKFVKQHRELVASGQKAP